MYKGWTIKPTPRSETARLRSNVFKGFGNELVFLIACIVTMFNTMAAYDEKALKTQLTMYVEWRSFFPIVVCNCGRVGFPWTLLGFIFAEYFHLEKFKNCLPYVLMWKNKMFKRDVLSMEFVQSPY